MAGWLLSWALQLLFCVGSAAAGAVSRPHSRMRLLVKLLCDESFVCLLLTACLCRLSAAGSLQSFQECFGRGAAPGACPE